MTGRAHRAGGRRPRRWPPAWRWGGARHRGRPARPGRARHALPRSSPPRYAAALEASRAGSGAGAAGAGGATAGPAARIVVGDPVRRHGAGDPPALSPAAPPAGHRPHGAHRSRLRARRGRRASGRSSCSVAGVRLGDRCRLVRGGLDRRRGHRRRGHQAGRPGDLLRRRPDRPPGGAQGGRGDRGRRVRVSFPRLGARADSPRGRLRHRGRRGDRLQLLRGPRQPRRYRDRRRAPRSTTWCTWGTTCGSASAAC